MLKFVLYKTIRFFYRLLSKIIYLCIPSISRILILLRLNSRIINQFNKSISRHKKYLNEDNIFIFGIKPMSPSSEYGYFLTKKLSRKLYKVRKFIEKPNKNKLKIIIREKGYMNSGIFFIR